MKCHACAFDHKCRTDLELCPSSRTSQAELVAFYQQPDHQRLVQAAARLVDGGRAGTLTRLEEIIEYVRELGLRKLGLAYCYGLEREAAMVADLLRAARIPHSSVSCTTGALAQRTVNEQSELGGVSCNPAGQAAQLMADGVDLVVTMGLCLGHDLLLQKALSVPVTTLVVKDRTNGHHPLQAIRDMHARALGTAR
jgi:uncharacterized metal-binding protein